MEMERDERGRNSELLLRARLMPGISLPSRVLGHPPPHKQSPLEAGFIIRI